MKKNLLIAILLLAPLFLFSQQTGSFTKTWTFSTTKYPNQSRTMAYYVPANYSANKKYKLFISLGGQGWTPANDLKSPYGAQAPGTVDLLNSTSCTSTVGDYIAVSPSISPQAYQAGAPDGTWPYPDDADDGLPEAIIALVSQTYNIDTSAVYLTGFSLGARGALFLGLQSYKVLKGLILFTPAVQGLKEAKNQNYYQTAANPYCKYLYSNAKQIPVVMYVGANDPNGAGCSFCTPPDPTASYANVVVPEVNNQIVAAGAANMIKYQKISGLGHARPSASYMCSALTFIDGLTATAVSDVQAKGDLQVFPNPSSGIFSVWSDNGSQAASLEVFNMIGENIPASYSVNADGVANINMSAADNGLYFVKLSTSDGAVLTRKIVISK